MLTLAAEACPAQPQHGFAEAIFNDDAAITAAMHATCGPALVSRFGVYRKNAIAGLINAVAARYPVVRKLLWDDAFTQIAHLYVMTEPPRSPVLPEYGENFPRFLRAIGEGCAAEYLADIAALEAARTRAHHAAHATPLLRDAFGALGTDALPDLRLRLHPSVQLLKSRFPVVSIWEANFFANDNGLRVWQPECALIARPRHKVEVWRLRPSTFEFFAALSEGKTIADAIAHGRAASPDLDLAACLATLIKSDVVVDMESDAAP
jgi:Putative DNA-binding domain